MKIKGLRKINSMWHKERLERGQFQILAFGDRTLGWVFRPEQPVLENHVGYRCGFETKEAALEDLKQFVQQSLSR